MTILEKLEWAYHTLKDQLKFGLPEEQAIIAREKRVRGVLKDVIDELSISERAHLILDNKEDVFFATQEAAYYNYLDDKIREAEQYSANLEEENGKLIKALKFYANPYNYNHLPATSHPDCMDFVGFVQEREAGDLARKTLKEIGILENKNRENKCTQE